MDPKNLAGSVKIAILVQSLGKEAARTIISGLDEEQREEVANHLSQMGPISPEIVEAVAREFVDRIRSKKIEEKPKPKEEKKETDNKEDKEKSNLAAIRELDPEQLFNIIKNEHPQTIAIVLVHLNTSVASDILSRLPDEIKTEVAFRIANLDKVVAGMIEEINNVFEEILKNKDTTISEVTGGVDKLAEILNQTDEISSELILTEIEETNTELVAQIKQKMFVFEDLVLIDDRGFQKLLRKVETAELAIALKAASEEVKDKVFKNMSARAGEMLNEEMEDLGPVRMTEVAEAQGKITTLIQELESRGDIIISGRRGEELIA